MMEDSKFIYIKGARQHNLKNIELKIPKNRFVVITGLSGSGKSSLAFDTIFAEGQRRYIESLSSYARQFLKQYDKPDVDLIEGLSPTIAIQQKGVPHNPRSTVGTMTEIYDYMRVLFARIGKPYCIKCSRPIKAQSKEEIYEEIVSIKDIGKAMILAPVVEGRKGVFKELFERLRTQGFIRVRVDGYVYLLEEEITLNRNKKHTVEVVIDRVEINEKNSRRIKDSLEVALKVGGGIVKIVSEKGKEYLFSQHYACPNCKISLKEISPRIFSFNSPYGACPECSGLGEKLEVAEDLVVPDSNLSIEDGAIKPWADPITNRRGRWKYSARNYYMGLLEDVCSYYDIPMDVPFKKLPKKFKNIIFYGSPDPIYEDGTHFEGVIRQLERRYYETESDFVKEEIMNRYMRKKVCSKCKGKRLKEESLSVKINGKDISQVSDLSIKEAKSFFKNLELSPQDKKIAEPLLKEILSRLEFLENVGLSYITLSRSASTLAGGEVQRINLATQIGSGLTGVIYVLDEPTIGLHQRDNKRLITTMKRLRDLGNTLIVVEHDEETIRSSDWIIDLGPGAGINGGEVVFTGKTEDILKCENSLTGKYLKGELKIPVRKERRKPKGYLTLKGCREHNLKNITVRFPLGVFTCITGVSGSGKSTLMEDILWKAISRKLYGSKELPGDFDGIEGLEKIDKVIKVDQSPIGKTPRSNPATYTKVFDLIRDFYSQLPLSKARGYKPGRFSFNVPGGRCEACKGDGMIKIEMHFLPDVYVTCETCKGKRFNEETLDVTYKGKNIADVLDMTVEEAIEFFYNFPKIREKLLTLWDVGLSYIKLGQPATTLSGGEAQRIKLSRELSKKATGKTLYLLDEPTTGLHFADVEKLLNVLHRLVDKGNTVVVIEHNMEVIKTADYIIDLGPEGGEEGGYIVGEGTPEEIVKVKGSYTGQILKKYLNDKS
ncbi:MAG: excinuclease ABC subunit UvrA [Caldiserica bacterium]|nr:MAG: excinuclease ABC subunit UvrA [Caldisericota bacterium]